MAKTQLALALERVANREVHTLPLDMRRCSVFARALYREALNLTYGALASGLGLPRAA